jgi:hypothetical protein
MGACRGEELRATVKELRYLAAKTVARNALAVEADLVDAESMAFGDAELQLSRRRFVQSGHVLDRCDKRREAEATL